MVQTLFTHSVGACVHVDSLEEGQKNNCFESKTQTEEKD